MASRVALPNSLTSWRQSANAYNFTRLHLAVKVELPLLMKKLLGRRSNGAANHCRRLGLVVMNTRSSLALTIACNYVQSLLR